MNYKNKTNWIYDTLSCVNDNGKHIKHSPKELQERLDNSLEQKSQYRGSILEKSDYGTKI